MVTKKLPLICKLEQSISAGIFIIANFISRPEIKVTIYSFCKSVELFGSNLRLGTMIEILTNKNSFE